MNYTSFKNAYTSNRQLSESLRKNKGAFFLVQKTFDETFPLFFYNDSFTSALWYTNLLDKFKSLIENTHLNSSEKLQEAIAIYKPLLTKSRYYAIEQKNNNNIKIAA